MRLEEQQDFIRANGGQVFDDAVGFLVAHREQIIAGMPVRLIAGYPDYGDTSWRADAADLAQGAYEEAVDLLNYMAFALYERQREYVVLPEPSDGPDD
jgi:hypothetical protein